MSRNEAALKFLLRVKWLDGYGLRLYTAKVYSVVMLSTSCAVDSMINCSSTTLVSSPVPSQAHAVGSGKRLVQPFDCEGLCQVQVSLWSVTSKTATVFSYSMWLYPLAACSLAC